MKVAPSTESLVSIYHTTRCHILVDSNFHAHWYENLRNHVLSKHLLVAASTPRLTPYTLKPVDPRIWVTTRQAIYEVKITAKIDVWLRGCDTRITSTQGIFISNLPHWAVAAVLLVRPVLLRYENWQVVGGQCRKWSSHCCSVCKKSCAKRITLCGYRRHMTKE
jgi:hypothetical protein